MTDSRAKPIEGLYVRLGERKKVFVEIQRDAQLCSPFVHRISAALRPYFASQCCNHTLDIYASLLAFANCAVVSVPRS
jgi:hypothetical protein